MAFRPLTAVSTSRRAQVHLSADQPVRVEPLSVPRSISPHDHEFYEICLFRAGSAVHSTADADEPAGRGTVVVVAPGQIHAFSRVRDLEVTNAYYLSDWLMGELSNKWDNDALLALFLSRNLFPDLRRPAAMHCRLTEAETCACEVELNDLHAEGARKPCSPAFLRAGLIKLMIYLSRAFARESSGAAGFGFRPEVLRALRIIEDRLADGVPLVLEELAERTQISPAHLSRVFRQATGSSPMDYYQRRRTQRASALLLNPRFSITEVAHELGYCDGAHFYRMFHRHHGQSPRSYRARFLGHGPDRDDPGMARSGRVE